MEDTFYITTPIYYPNGAPHMGHAYTTVICDIMARYMRLPAREESARRRAYFLTGTDENAQNIVQKAEAAGLEPRAFADGNVARFKELFAALGISYDRFIRTSDREAHWPGAQALWRAIETAGDLYKAPYEGLYCTGCEAFVTERDLVDGKCPDHGSANERVSEENYFFRLSRYTDEIARRIERDELLVAPETRKREILALLAEGLEDISFSRPARALSWGIPVSGDESQVIYVWCDALANYITALGYGREDDALFREFWPADYHVVGKDILRFHAAIWPAMLLSAGLALPRRILVHGMITSGGRKMSKTLGNIVDPAELIERYGAEAVRYYLAREISPFEDGDLTHDSFREAYNANLANGIGNLAARVMKLAATHLAAPVVAADVISDEVAEGKYRYHMERFEISRAADVIWDRIGELDGYIEREQPFKTIKTDESKAKRDIVYLVGALSGVAEMLAPLIPETAEKIKAAIGRNEAPEALFPRID